MKLRSIQNLYPHNLVKRAINKAKALNRFSAAPFLNRSGISVNLARKDVIAGNHWDIMLNEILNEINAAPMSFLRSPVISRTVHPNQQILAKIYFDELLAYPLFTDKILPKLQDPPMGNPYLCEFFPLTSPLSLQHVYYLNLINEKYGFFLPESKIGQVVEVGGGYGNLPRLLKSFGYEGKHTIIDLPEMQTMQQHYLSHVLSRKQQGDIGYKSIGEEIVTNESPSLLIATFSISEMPIETRRALEGYYDQFNYLFFAYNTSFDGVDNRHYFEELKNNLDAKFKTSFFKDEHRTAWFLLCERK